LLNLKDIGLVDENESIWMEMKLKSALFGLHSKQESQDFDPFDTPDHTGQ
jgi:hypothetical protein